MQKIAKNHTYHMHYPDILKIKMRLLTKIKIKYKVYKMLLDMIFFLMAILKQPG